MAFHLTVRPEIASRYFVGTPLESGSPVTGDVVVTQPPDVRGKTPQTEVARVADALALQREGRDFNRLTQGTHHTR